MFLVKNKIVYGQWVFSDVKIASGNENREQSLDGTSLAIDTLEVEVKCADPSITQFVQNAPMTFFHRDRQRGIYYLQSVERVSPDHYVLFGITALGLLSQRKHKGGIYTGQTVQAIVREICGPVPVHVKSNLANIALYGWLPYAEPPERSARDNLSQVLFAIGAYLGTDLDGFLRIESLWDGVASAVTPGRIYQGASVEYTAAVTSVTVTEHQYAAVGGSEETLFEGTAQQGDIIKFSGPMYDLNATGFAIQSSGANFAVLTAGTGTLTGKPYLHTTRSVTEPVTDSSTENIKTYKDATLVSLVNSVAVAKRLAAYHKCTQTIHAEIVAGAERPGHVVSIYHPYAKKMVSACILSMDAAVSGVLKADTPSLVGYAPQQPGEQEYLDSRVVLTGKGTFIKPGGVNYIKYVLISGADGGHCGAPGEDASDPPHVSWTNPTWGDSFSGYGLSTGGVGGVGGVGGNGGRIVEGDLDATELTEIPYDCGVGGMGADPGDPETPGERGTDTVFAGVTTENGSSIDTGYVDVVTGEIFAATGQSGVAGADGAGKDPTVDKINSDTVAKYTQAKKAYDENGNEYLPGITQETEDAPGQLIIGGDFSQGWSSQVPGGAPAAGVNGTDGGWASQGRDGKSPTLIPQKPNVYGMGGRGGYGGGGGSTAGIAIKGTSRTGGSSPMPAKGIPGKGALGSKGGPGADGCIILYMRKAIGVPRGQLATRDKKSYLDRLGRRFIV